MDISMQTERRKIKQKLAQIKLRVQWKKILKRKPEVILVTLV